MTESLTRRTLLAAAGTAFLPARHLHAQETGWPTRPIKVLIPSSPGGASDALARLLFDQLSPALRQAIVIENRPGASGAIATQAVVRAEPDGYTLLYGTASATVMAQALIPKLPYDVLTDMEPIGITAWGGVMLVVNPEVPANDLPELVQLLKSQPDRYPSYASWGVGSNGHLTMEWLKQRTGIRINHVPYRTFANELTDLASGVIKVGWVDIVSPMGFITQGRLRPIAVNGEPRSPMLPNLKTMTEQGFPFPSTGWQGLFAPKGTPATILNRLNTEINRVFADARYQQGVHKLNVPPTPILTRDQFKTILATDLKVWRDIVVKGNIRVE